MKQVRSAFGAALAKTPDYAPAEAGLARLDVAAGRLPAAIGRVRRVVERLPLQEYVVNLGEIELAAGRAEEGRRTLQLVRVQQRLLGNAGINTDAKLAVYEADHGNRHRAVKLARDAWANAPSVRSADALGWALTRAGSPRQGLKYARRALRLGSPDASFLYHAGISARAAGQHDDAARLLREALAPIRASRHCTPATHDGRWPGCDHARGGEDAGCRVARRCRDTRAARRRRGASPRELHHQPP